MEWLKENSNGLITSENKEIIQLNKLKHKNIDIKQPKREELESIFRIVNAPINDGIKFHPERNKLWNDQSWGNEHTKYLFSTLGKCVAIAGKNINNTLPEETLEEDVIDIIDSSLLFNVEDAYKVMLLNRLNSYNYLLKQSDVDYKKLQLFEEDYYISENYILSLLDNSYGTVRELYSKIESVCGDYLNITSLEKRFKNNQLILSNRNQERITKENDRLSILGILITILVSFPAINETLIIFQRELITNDIKGISVFGLSIFFEILLLIFLFDWYTKRNK